MSAGQSTTLATTEEQTEWREHPTLTGYRVSSCGRVQTRWRLKSLGRLGNRSVLGDTWRELKPGRLPRGYRFVRVSVLTPGADRPSRRNQYVHRLVVETFLGPIPAHMEVCHRNGRPTDNRLDNLYVGTRQQNVDDQLTHGTRARGSRHGNAKLTESIVADIITRLMTGETSARVAQAFGVSAATVRLIRTGDMWPHVPRPDQPFPNTRPRRDRHWKAKLSAADVEAIKEQTAAGESRAAVARRFNVSSSTVSRIALGKGWAA